MKYLLLGESQQQIKIVQDSNIRPVVCKNAGQMKVRLVTPKEKVVDMAWI